MTPSSGRYDTVEPMTGFGDDVDQALARLDALATVLDSLFVLPGTNVRVGLDAIIGLIPGIGDLISGAISTYIIYEARRLGASRLVIARMLANTAFDTLFGAVPVVGDAFDVLFRANRMNVALLREHLKRKQARTVIDGEFTRVR